MGGIKKNTNARCVEIRAVFSVRKFQDLELAYVGTENGDVS